jgi:anti-sigma B factor antagonist
MALTWCYEQELPSDLHALPPLYTTLRHWANAAGLDESESYRLAVVVSEAVTNAITHAHGNAPGKTVRFALGVEGTFLIAEIGDRGRWGWIPPDPPDADHWEQTHGRGIQLIRSLAHRAEFLPRPGGGTLVRVAFQSHHVKSLQNTIMIETKKSGQGDEQMETRTESYDNVDVLRIAGRIDLVTSNTLKDTIREHLHRQRNNLVLNLEQVDFINSSGLGSLVSILKDVRVANGNLVLSNLAPYVQEIFDITQLSNVFESFASEQEAVDVLSRQTNSVAVNP